VRVRIILPFSSVVDVVGLLLGGKLNECHTLLQMMPRAFPRIPDRRVRSLAQGWVFGFRVACTRDNPPKRVRNVRLRKIAAGHNEHSNHHVVSHEIAFIGVVQHKLTTGPANTSSTPRSQSARHAAGSGSTAQSATLKSKTTSSKVPQK
jgi:hypothetical protein